MKITIESTETIEPIDGLPMRLWKGTSENGAEVWAYIRRIAVRDADSAETSDLLATGSGWTPGGETQP